MMSEMTFVILDEHRAIHSQQHGSLLDRLVASLNAEPETIEELEAAVGRFVARVVAPFARWHAGTCDEPYDAGIAIVDLAARLVVTQSTYSAPGPSGQVFYRDADRDLEAWLPYHVSDDWRFVRDVDTWEGLADSRRRDRQPAPRLDARQVLYGRVAEFVVAECIGARGPTPPGGTWISPEGWSLTALPERAKPGNAIESADAVAEIHARWLMTPREDLGGRSPRDLLQEKREHLTWDIQDRSQQWSMLGECPRPLSEASAAYRLGGFGTHENIVYYDMVRHLAWECWQRVVEPPADAAPAAESPMELAAWLRRVQEEWLGEPDWENFSGRTPAEVIRSERERIPMACSGKEAMIDDDCPLCEMLAEGPQPVFWCLDGCNMDDDFPFSLYCPTRQEWEEEQHRREEFNRTFDEEWKMKQAVLEGELPGSEDGGQPSIWTRSLTTSDTREESPWVRLFGIGCHVAELAADLKVVRETAALAQTLSRCFGNFRCVLTEPSASLLEPVVDRFCQELAAVVESRPDLSAKCADLERQLREFAAAADINGKEDLPL